MNLSDLRGLCLFEAKLFAILWLPQRFYDRLLEADRDEMSSSGRSGIPSAIGEVFLFYRQLPQCCTPCVCGQAGRTAMTSGSIPFVDLTALNELRA